MKQKGFTLIELLVTMGIIAVLTGMAVFNFNQSRMRARDVQRKSDLSQLVKALEMYKNDNGVYPLTTSSSSYGFSPDDKNIFQADLLSNNYIKTTFNDPKGSEWQNYKYVTASETDTKTYYLMACLENTADSTRAIVAQCTHFYNGRGAPDQCQCGGTDIANYSGVMYVVSNP